MIMPPQAHGVKVISIGMFTAGNDAVVWRGPMLHRALQQFLADVYWGDLDVLLLDLPPGTGDIAISTAQLLPNAELLVVTTPQQAAAEVAERAGAIALQTHQRLVGVVENMSWLELPDGTRMDVFGTGGGQTVRRLADPHDRRAGAAARARSRSSRGCASAATRAPRSSCRRRSRRRRRRGGVAGASLCGRGATRGHVAGPQPRSALARLPSALRSHSAVGKGFERARAGAPVRSDRLVEH